VSQDPGSATFTELDARRLGRVRRYFAQHPRASDVLVCAMFALSAVSDVGPAVGSRAPEVDGGQALLPGASGDALSLALTVLALVVLWFRRRWPVPVAVTACGLAVAHVAVAGHVGALDVACALALYVVAATLPQRVGWSVLLGTTALVLGALLLWGGTSQTVSAGGVMITGPDGEIVQTQPEAAAATDTPSLVLGSLIALAVGANVRARRLHVRGLVDRHRQLMDAGEQQARLAAAAEQTRIAREMHDVVAHGLTVMIALSDGARSAVRRSPEHAEEALDLLSEAGRSALADMRRMLGVLRGADVPLEPQPGTQDLESLVQQFRSAGLTVHLTVAGTPLPADAGLALTVYRVVQESLTNVLRHAGAGARADVLVRSGDGRVGIEVVDDGGPAARPVDAAPDEGGRLARLGGLLSERRDTDPLRARTDAAPVTGAVPVPPGPARAGRGIVGMRERAAVYRGTVSAGPDHAGWRVHVELRTEDLPPGGDGTRPAGSTAPPTTAEEDA
jgi:signal transduction histidine kinase